MNRSPQQYALGQYMTPAGVAHKLLDLVELPPAEWYVLDPACGDGNLLVRIAQLQNSTYKFFKVLIGQH